MWKIVLGITKAIFEWLYKNWSKVPEDIRSQVYRFVADQMGEYLAAKYESFQQNKGRSGASVKSA